MVEISKLLLSKIKLRKKLQLIKMLYHIKVLAFYQSHVLVSSVQKPSQNAIDPGVPGGSVG